jgi:hypothetical protein
LTAVKPTPKFGYLGEDFDRNRVDPPRTKGRGEAATGTKSLLVAQGLRACELEALAQFPEPKIDSYQRGYEAPYVSLVRRRGSRLVAPLDCATDYKRTDAK